jgi:hypothetical protein
MLSEKISKPIFWVTSLALLLFFLSFGTIVSSAPQGEPVRQRSVGDYTAFSLLRVAYREPRLVTHTEPREPVDPREFDIFRRTQATLIRSRFVLNGALRMPGIADLAIIKRHEDPVTWLTSDLSVSFPDDGEVLQISLNGDNPDEMKAIVNAVTDAYMDSIVNAEQSERAHRVTHLEKVHDQISQKVHNKHVILDQLHKALAEPQTEVGQRIAIEHIVHIKQELTRVNLELIKARVDQSTEEKVAGSKSKALISDSAVSDQVEAEQPVAQLRYRVAALQETIDQVSKTVGNKQNNRLVSLTQDLEASSQALESKRSEVRTAVIERLRSIVTANSQADAIQTDRAIAILNAQREHLQTELESEQRGIAKSANTSFEIQFVSEELAEARKVQSAVAAQLDALNRVSSRVLLLQRAEVLRSNK